MSEHAVAPPEGQEGQEGQEGYGEPAYEPDPRRWRILGVTLVVGFMALLDVSIVNVAIPSMRTGLGPPPSPCQWGGVGLRSGFGLTMVAGGARDPTAAPA